MIAAPGAGGGPEPPGRVPAAGPGELGGASLVALALTAFLLLAGLLAVDVGALVAARAAAQTAADMAALAALTPSDGSAAARAAAIASANGTELVVCDCSAVQAVVRVGWREPGGGPSSSARPSPATQALLAATLVAAPVGSSRRASGRTSEPGCRARHHRDRRRGRRWRGRSGRRPVRRGSPARRAGARRRPPAGWGGRRRGSPA